MRYRPSGWRGRHERDGCHAGRVDIWLMCIVSAGVAYIRITRCSRGVCDGMVSVGAGGGGRPAIVLYVALGHVCVLVRVCVEIVFVAVVVIHGRKWARHTVIVVPSFPGFA